MKLRFGLIVFFVGGFAGGILGQTILFFKSHARAAEKMLHDDFKILIFLKRLPDENRGGVVLESVRAISGTDSAALVLPEDALARIEARDPTVFRSVSVLGENPLPTAIEVKLKPEALGRLPVWASAAQAIEETEEVVYKPMQVRALLQAGFYERAASLCLSFAAASLCFWIALVLAAYRMAGRRLQVEEARELKVSAGVSALGTLVGACVVRLIAMPAGQGLVSPAGGWFETSFMILLAAAAAAAAVASRIMNLGGETALFSVHQRRSAAAAAVLTLFPAGFAGAASVGGKRLELKQVNEELLRQKREVAEIQRLMGEEGKMLSEVEGEKKRAAARVEALKGIHMKTDAKRMALDEKLRSLESGRAKGEDHLSAEIVEYGRVAAAREVFYDSDSLWEEAYRRNAIREKTVYIAKVRMMDADVFGERQQAAREGLSIQRKALKELELLRSRELTARLHQERFEKASQEASKAEKKLKDLEASARELAGLIRELSQKEERASVPPSRSVVLGRNSLPWPVLGQVTRGFGKQKVPELNTWTIHNGLEISASKGVEVQPVMDGTVVFAGPFRSYGNVIIVNHGQGFFSIYGHVSRIRVGKGEKVRSGRAIAEVGGVGSGLYLEFRQAGAAFDPAPYLKGMIAGRQ